MPNDAQAWLFDTARRELNSQLLTAIFDMDPDALRAVMSRCCDDTEVVPLIDQMDHEVTQILLLASRNDGSDGLAVANRIKLWFDTLKKELEDYEITISVYTEKAMVFASVRG